VRAEVHTGFWWGNLKERDHMEGYYYNNGSSGSGIGGQGLDWYGSG